jgi:hypothetical protein
MMRWILLLISATAFCDSTIPEVQEGELWTTTVNVAVPKASYPALQNYLTTLISSRPLPWPYYLEKASLTDGTVTLQGRLLRTGTYCLPLGVFAWHGTSYSLPSLVYVSNPIRIPVLSANDLLLPFPNVALFQSPDNREQLLALLQQNQATGYAVLFWQERLRHALAILSLLFICLPILVQLWRWRNLRKPVEPPIPTPTIAETLQEVIQLQREGQTPWPQLVKILNTAASTTSLTSYELEQRFSSEGRIALAKAAASIEERGYKPGNEQYFPQTIRLIEDGLK